MIVKQEYDFKEKKSEKLFVWNEFKTHIEKVNSIFKT